jgi:HD-like signal output (HDOD) protein
MRKWLSRLFGHPNSRSERSAIAPSTEATPSVNSVANAAGRSLLDIDGLFYTWLLNVDVNRAGEPNQAEERFLRALEMTSVASDEAVAALVPRMPAVIPLLLQSLRDKNISNARLSELISQDATLVAAVIRQANSSYHRRSTTISSIEHALAILGQNGLRLLVAIAAFKPLINVQSGHFTKFAAPRISDLSNRCAVACRSLAMQKHIDPFEPFLAAVVQNVGLIVALRVMDQVYDGKGLPQSPGFCASFAHYARLLSCRIAREWNFPDTVISAITDEAVSNTPASMSALGQVLYLADKLSKIRVMVNNGYLRDEDVEDWLAGKDMQNCAQCYREVVESEINDADHPPG